MSKFKVASFAEAWIEMGTPNVIEPHTYLSAMRTTLDNGNE